LNQSSRKGGWEDPFLAGLSEALVVDENPANQNYEKRNLFLLGVVFTVYFGFRSGCLIAMPLVSKDLLKEYLGGTEFSPLYQLPLCLWFIMDVLIATPNAMYMGAYGRRSGFLVGCSCAVLASIWAFFVLRFLDHTPLLAFGLLNVAVVLMSVVGMAEFVRFAAAEACVDSSRSNVAVSRVLTGGAVFSLVGPTSASTGQWLSPTNHVHGYAYFFLFMTVLAFFGVVAAMFLRLPQPRKVEVGESPPVCAVLARPAVTTAIIAQVCVQFGMLLPMSAAPLTMVEELGLVEGSFLATWAIVLHVLCMFIPGLFSGKWTNKIGIMPMMLVGLALQAAGMICGLCFAGVRIFFIYLALLGIGWNFAFVAGTMLVISSHTMTERTKVTSVNETLRFVGNACAVLISSSVTWHHVSAICLLSTCIVVAALFVSRCFSKRVS